METVDERVKEFLKAHNDFSLLPSGKVTRFYLKGSSIIWKKIRCIVTNHEMPVNVDVLQQHFNGKRYKLLLKSFQADFSKYEPHIIQSDRNSKKLYCKLTKEGIFPQLSHI